MVGGGGLWLSNEGKHATYGSVSYIIAPKSPLAVARVYSVGVKADSALIYALGEGTWWMRLI